MKEMSISTKAPKVNKEATVTIMVPETGEEALQMFGGEAVKSNAVRNWIVTIQAGVRRGLEKGKSETELQTVFKSAKMGAVTMVGGGIVDPLQAALAKSATMTPEELQAFIKQLQTQAAGAAKPAAKPAAA